MKTSKLIYSLTLGFAFFFSSVALAQDVVTWTTHRNGSRVADTVALADYLPVKDNIVYIETVLEVPDVSKEELFLRAKLAVQKSFASSKMGASNHDAKEGIVSINNYYDISDMSTAGFLFSSKSITDQYFFNAFLSILVKDGRYKIKMEIPEYTYGYSSKNEYYNFKSNVMPISRIANRKKVNKRQRIRVLKTLNEKMLITFDMIKKEMERKLDNDF